MDRRSFMKSTALSMGAIMTGSAGCTAINTKPNIIWIMADDLGYGDLGCYGAKDIPTPNIDSLAAQGVKCNSFYAAAPTCTPSRASVLSGRYPEAIGMTDVLMGEGGMRSDVVTVAEVLKANGYATGLVGKWHLGYSGVSRPNYQGFDEFYGHLGGKIDFFEHTDSAQKIDGNPMGKHDFYDNTTEISAQGYATDLFTDRALRFVNNHKESLFFLFLSYNAPHYSRYQVMQAPEKYLAKFAKDPENPTMRETYTAMVSCMDDGIGELLTYLRKNGLEENTLIIFVSDNGADPTHGGSNGVLSGGKWNRKEGGIRVPMIARWPGQIPADQTTHEAIHMIDFFPTMLSAAGIPKPQSLKLDGLDVLDVLKGKAALPDRPLFFGEETVRKGKWKRMGDELYDLEQDMEEANNLASDYPEILDQLKALSRP